MEISGRNSLLKKHINLIRLTFLMIKFLNSKEIKKILNWLKEKYEIKDLELDYVFLENKKEKIFLISKKLRDLDFKNLRINSIGLYFAKREKNGFRLSIEGSQLIGKVAKKNVVEIDEEKLRQWVRGNDLDMKIDSNDYVIIKNNNDFYGVGKYKNNKILNFTPKNRRVTSSPT